MVDEAKPQTPVDSLQDPRQSPHFHDPRLTHEHARLQARNNDWHLVFTENMKAISPFLEGAADMREFYWLVFSAASTHWAQTLQPRKELHIVWRRVSMAMTIEGLDAIPWEVVARYAASMLDYLLRPGTIASTYDSFYLKVGQNIAMYAGVRLLEFQDAVNSYLHGISGTLDPASP
ncbi:MAG: hypothetical protein Q9218_005159 [Villophora microphyllina]